MNKLTKIISRYPLVWIVLLFLSLPILAFPEIIFGQQTLYWTDLSWIHYPRHIFAAEEWLAGRVPLWDPYEDTGIPLLAEAQVGVLYPVSVLFLSPLSASLELSLFILIHFTLAALFTFTLARSLAMSRPAATVAGLAFGLGGFLMAQLPNLNIMTGAAWLPLILCATILTTRQRSWLVAMLTGIPLAFQILTAQPQVTFYTLVIIIGYGWYRIMADFLFGSVSTKWNIRHALRTALLIVVAIISGLLLAAPQLLPTLELQQLSKRADGRGLGFLTENSLPPIMWLNLLLPGAFGNNVVGFKGGDPFQEVFIYTGFLPLLLAFFSWGQRHKRDMLFFLFLLTGGALLALGRHTPLYRYLIQYLPGFDLFRIPSRWLMAVNLALAILAGFGLETLRHKGVSRSALITLLLISLMLLAGLLLIWTFRADLLAWSSIRLNEPYRKFAGAFLTGGFSPNPAYQNRLMPGWITGLSIPALLLTINIIISAGLFAFLAAGRTPYRTFATLAIIAISVDLTAAGGTTINPAKPATWWQQLSGGAKYVLENVEQARVFPLGMGSEEAAVSHLGQYFPSVYGVHSAGGHGSSLLIARYNTFLHEADPVQAIQVVGARYLLSLGQMGADVASTYPLAYRDENSFVYENRNPLHRAFIVHHAVRVNGPAQALSYFQSRSIDPGQTVVLETEADLPDLPIDNPPASSTATIISQNPQVLEIETNLADRGYLVLLDTYYPGWTATVDGTETTIYRANYIGRAVFVPAGEHLVRFEYQPLSFKVGLWLSLFMLTILTVTAFAGIGLAAQRRSHCSSPAQQASCSGRSILWGVG